MATEPSRAAIARNTYLNDHLAGAQVALQMLDRLIEVTIAPDKQFFTELRGEIAEDRDTLESLLNRVGGHTSALRQLGGWIAERASRLKFIVDDPTRGTLERLEALELLVVGIHGKQLLWRALASATVPALGDVDFDGLERRAQIQHDRVEARRLESARRVLSDDEEGPARPDAPGTPASGQV